MPEHVDKRIQTELINLALQQIVQSGLRHAKAGSSVFLLQAARLDIPFDARHQIGSQQQILGFLMREAQVAEYVSASARDLQFFSHRRFLSLTSARNRLRASSMSRCAVRFALEGMRFFAGESCGKCFPCRIGTTRLRERLEHLSRGSGSGQTPANGVAEMPDIIDVLHTGSACGLGPAAGTLAKHLLAFFHDEVEEHAMGHCPAEECDNI